MDSISEAKKRYPFVWLMYAVFLGVIFVSGMLLQKLTPIVEMCGDIAPWIMTILTSYVIGFPILILLLRKAPTEAPQRNKVGFGWLVAVFAMTITLSMTASLVGSPIVLLLNRVTQSFSGATLSSGGAESVIRGSDLAWTIAVAVIIGPIVEELAFRKLLIDRIYKYGEGMAILMSAVAFSLFHQNTTQLFYTAAMGAAFAYVYIRTGNILNSIGLHIACNCVTSLVMRQLDPTALTSAATLPEEEQIAIMMQVAIPFLVIVVVWIAGLILLIINLRKKTFHLCAASANLPKGTRGIAFANIGFAVYLITVIVLMVI